ncbi:Hypothetical protein, putative [Bodo saltans]|uniref:Uncharacterized protein n=1 Tax=Bodo saltans TaxID=75058 RepID=A0A0S4IXR3_BODSA|nr:Hypothetical protein, putative [Bodo saltans]|eukprot:CUG44432.1 Hypothetical protein, putative [Bodo saltans]
MQRSYFKDAEGKSVYIDHAYGDLADRTHSLMVGSNRMELTLSTFPPNPRPVFKCHVITANTKKVFSWIKETAGHAKEHAVREDMPNGRRYWYSYGIFLRGVNFVCRDMRELLDAMLICEIARKIPCIIVHSDGLSIANNLRGHHLDVAGKVRTPETARDVAERAIDILVGEFQCTVDGSVLVVLLDTRACEMWYITFFQECFSQFYTVVKVFFSDVSRKSMCDPEDVEAINPLYTKFLASMPPMESLSDARLKTDTAQFLGFQASKSGWCF